MCGITGYWRFGGDDFGDEYIAKMTAALVHRGPDSSGTWREQNSGIALGHRRLAIVDLSQAGHQPMHSASGRYAISYNGEVYNAAELRLQLNRHFRGSSDTEVLLEACDYWGVEAACKRLIGMFAFALWDKEQRKLYLVRDRLGVKPLYWGFHSGSLLFGSELKSLVCYPYWKPEIDSEAVSSYFRVNYIKAPRSIYRDIYKLEPGHILTIDAQRQVKKTCYWQLEADLSLREDETEAAFQIEALLKDAVKRRMISDVPIGAFLSGGIDSSMIVALMQTHSTKPIKTFSIGSEFVNYDESSAAAAIAKHLGTEHHSWRITEEDVLDLIPQLAEVYDEPFGDASQIPTMLVSRLARQYVKVILSGDGGDELFAGYNRYWLGHLYWPFAKKVPLPLRRLTAVALQRLPASRFAERVFKVGHWLSASDEAEFYERSISQWPDRFPLASVRPSLRWGGRNDFVRFMQLEDLKTYLPDDILAKVDRASMAFGLEAREAYLDHRVVELALALPIGLKIKNNQTKWILRQILKRYVPESLNSMQKMGFGVPIDAWLRGSLREWAEHLLEPKRLERSGLDVELIRTIWKEHLECRSNWQYPLWGVLMFEAWRQRWVV